MTKKEYNLIHTFVQALADESSVRGGIESNGRMYLMVSKEQLEQLLERITMLIEEDGTD